MNNKEHWIEINKENRAETQRQAAASEENVGDMESAQTTCCNSAEEDTSFGNASEGNQGQRDAERNRANKEPTLKRQPCGALKVENSYAANKNVAEGLMDIALLSANANQLRFLITYNHEASTYYISLALVILSLTMQVLVGIGLIFRRRWKQCSARRTNECLIVLVFMVTVVNILLAAFTTTDGQP